MSDSIVSSAHADGNSDTDLGPNSGTHRTWVSMLHRCTNPKRENYRYYGGRGIKVCERWFVYANFAADMGPRPDGCSLDRIDVDGNYEPSNCRWCTHIEQTRNKRNNRVFTIDGETLCLKEWSERTGIACMVILNRIKRGWTIRDAVMKPLTKYNPLTEADRPAIMAMVREGKGVQVIAKAFGKNSGDMYRFINRQTKAESNRPKQPKIADVIGKPTGRKPAAGGAQ